MVHVSFRHLFFFFALSILGVLSLLGIWLVHTFESEVAMREQRIDHIFASADLQELFLRTHREQQATSMYFYLPQQFAPLREADAELQQRRLMLEMQRTLHEGLDSWLPLRAAEMDSLLRVGLKHEGIELDYELLLLEFSPLDTLYHSTHRHAGWWRMGWETLHLRAQADTLPLYADGLRAYVLRRESVVPQVLATMLPVGLLCLGLAVLLLVLLRLLLRRREAEEEMTDFARNITHELKTPIAVALAAHESLLDFGALADAERREPLLHTSRRQLTHLSRLVEQVLTLHRHQSGSIALRPTPIDVPQLLHQLQDEHELKATKPVSIFVQLPSQPLPLVADATHLYNVLSNLIDNAVKYSPQEADVLVEVQLLEGEKPQIVFSVSDKGMGIATRHQARVWQRFYRVPQGDVQAARGYGLGLYYVQQLVLLMGGRVYLQSEVGIGTTVRVQLPLRPEAM